MTRKKGRAKVRGGPGEGGPGPDMDLHLLLSHEGDCDKCDNHLPLSHEGDCDEGDDNLLARIPPVSLIPDGPQTQLTLLTPEPSKTCPHGLVRYLEPCGRCWEQLQFEAFGWVDDAKYDPYKQYSRLCAHQLIWKKCEKCWPMRLCVHGREKQYCRICDGRKLCITCRRHIVKWVGTTCVTCKVDFEGRERKTGGKVVNRDLAEEARQKALEGKKPRRAPMSMAAQEAMEREARIKKELEDQANGGYDTPESPASEGEKDQGI